MAGSLFHSAAYHALDVAASARALLEMRVTQVPVAWRDQDVANTVAFLIGLHDIGKYTRSFQYKSAANWPASLGPITPPVEFPHDFAGYALLADDLHDILDHPLYGWRRSERMSLINAICGHHGRPVDAAKEIDDRVACDACLSAAHAFADDLTALFTPTPLPPPAHKGSPEVIWWIAGLTVLADWIGSSQTWFPYQGDQIDLPTYWHEHAWPHARRAVAQAGLLPSRLRTSLSLSDLLGVAATPSPVQALAMSVDLGGDGPALILVEDQTGSGKTEAALLLAHRLMACGRADGLFVALPTMATANAMYSRLAEAYRLLFAEDAEPSLVLTHGRSRDHVAFQDSILTAAAEGVSTATDPADEPASAQCAAWIADDRRRGFFASVGVGTIDQALLAVLPTRHAPLRLHGLLRKVLLVDEAHAYDSYMAEELMRLVAFHAGLGGSTIILSATLPQATRRRLISAYGEALGVPRSIPGGSAYPLMTVLQGESLAELPCEGRPGLARRVLVERVTTAQQALEEIVQAAKAGLAVAWIRNAVDDAAEAHAALAARGIGATLFHARFAMGDRMAIEDDVVRRFGKNSQSRAGVVVSTQVIEQSLDLDFDLIVTDLAPMDLLIQRAGRLWRHDRSERPVDRPRLLVLSPEPVEAPTTEWLGPELRRTGYVYADHSLLWRTARILFAAGAIAAPDDIRRLVEEAYALDVDLPEGLQRRAMQAAGKRSAEASLAVQNLLDWRRPYASNSGEWASDVATPTRLGEPSITLRLAKWDGAMLTPWCNAATDQRAWALSEVQVALRLASGVPVSSGDLARQEAKVRTSWRRWDQDVPILVLRVDAPGWVGTILRREQASVVQYDSLSGLDFLKRRT